MLLSHVALKTIMLVLKTLPALILLAVLLVVGIFVYAKAEKKNYQKLPDTKDLGQRISQLAASYTSKRPNATLTIGVLQNGKEQTFPSDSSALYEIGSITKVFTAITLAKLSLDGLLKLDDPVSKCFPTIVNIPNSITFSQLATHSSGLPRLPDNFASVAGNSRNPYALYKKEHLYEYLRTAKKLKTPGAQSEYSNLGYGLLGHALELCARKPYEDLVREHVLKPLGMQNTGTGNAPVIPGHNPKGKKTSNWNFAVLAPAGAFRSNVKDMLKFVRAQLEPDSTPIAPALRLSHQRHFKHWAGDCGLGWQFQTTFEDLTFIWHNGGTGGYISFIGFDPAHKTGVVLLSNYGDAFAGDNSLDKMGIEILKLASKISL